MPTTALIYLSPKYVSRHVRFVESVFPFAHLSAQSPRPQSDSIATWIPPPLRIPSSSLVPPLNPPSTVELFQQSPSETSSTPVLADTSSLPTSNEPANNLTSQQPPPQINPSEPHPQPIHTMTTKAKNNIHKPLTKMNLYT